MNCLPLIEAKRDGKALSPELIQSVVAAYTRGQIPDYQMAALLMAIVFRGMDVAETRALTDIDVAFVCMNPSFTMGVNDATNCVRAFRPKVVYPYHYREPSGSTANASTFKQRLGTEPGIETRLRKWY